MEPKTLDVINPEQAQTLAGLFRERVRRTPDAVAYRSYSEALESWQERTWSEMADAVSRWQLALKREGLEPGDRAAIMLRNSPEWVLFDQACLGSGLVTVPLYIEDRPENVAYILQNAGVKLLLIGGQEHWDRLMTVRDELGFLRRIITTSPVQSAQPDPRLKSVGEWLPDRGEGLQSRESAPGELATIVYTSGTTGRPKGVMLSHHNILWNAHSSLRSVPAYREDVFLSFLPLSHTLERTGGYYLPMLAGSTVAYNRSIPQLADDLLSVRPTVLISVPRIFERVYNKIQAGLEEKSGMARNLFRLAVKAGWQRFLHQQGRASWTPQLLLQPVLQGLVGGKVLAKLGGRLRIAVVGGAPLPNHVAELFMGLGLPMLQGYGLTETSPVITVNTPEHNDPRSVGRALADVELRIGDNEELLVRSPGVMLGYWDNPEATAAMIDAEGWLHTGDKARIDDGYVYITGRIKEIIVLANGEKVPPADMEMAISTDPLFEQILVLGENRPYLCALAVLNPEQWNILAHSLELPPEDPASLQSERLKETVIQRISERIRSFPGYAQIRQVSCQLEPWSIDDGLITPTLKLRRERILNAFQEEVEAMYVDH